MRITFSPQHRDDTLTLARSGDTLIINGAAVNFAGIPDGATLPAEAIEHDWIVGPVERIDGEIHVTLILPTGPSPSPAVAFPAPITVTGNGPIAVPHDPVAVPHDPED